MAPGTLGEIEASRRFGDLGTIGRLAHRLKSSAAAIGALRFAEQCREPEGLCAEGADSDARALALRLPVELEELRIALLDDGASRSGRRAPTSSPDEPAQP